MLIHRNIGNKSRQMRGHKSRFMREYRIYGKQSKLSAIAKDEKRNGRELLAIEMDRDTFLNRGERDRELEEMYHAEYIEDLQYGLFGGMPINEDLTFRDFSIDGFPVECDDSSPIDDPLNEGDDFNLFDDDYDGARYLHSAPKFDTEDEEDMVTHTESVYANPAYEREDALAAICDTIKTTLFVAQDDPCHELQPLEKLIVAQNCRPFVYKHAGQTHFMAYDNAACNRLVYLDGRYRVICAECAEDQLCDAVEKVKVEIARWIANGCVWELSAQDFPIIQSIIVGKDERFNCDSCCKTV